MIKVQNVTKQYGENKAVDHISFNAHKGEILGFLGPNGAGKTTTMNIITGYLSATEGSVQVGGFDVLENPMKTRAQIGYLPEKPPLYPDMTVKEYLSFVHALKKLGGNKNEVILEAAQRAQIEEVLPRLIKNLSKGYRQRVGLAQALMGNPPVIILDEPTAGLDPKQIIETRQLIRSLKNEHTVIFSSHILTEVQAVCDRVVVISGGKIVADDTPEKLQQAMSGVYGVTLELLGEEEQIYSALKTVKEIGTITIAGQTEPGVQKVQVVGAGPEDIRPAIFRALAKADLPILSMNSSGPSLEDIFLELTATGSTEEAEPQKEEA